MLLPTLATHQAAKATKNSLKKGGPFGKPEKPQKYPILTPFLTRFWPANNFFRGSHWENPKNVDYRASQKRPKIQLSRSKNRLFYPRYVARVGKKPLFWKRPKKGGSKFWPFIFSEPPPDIDKKSIMSGRGLPFSKFPPETPHIKNPILPKIRNSLF